MVEYALLLSLVALALVGTIGGMAGQVGGRFNAISNTLASGGDGGGPVAPDPSNPGTGGNHGNNPQTGNNNSGNNNGNISTDTSNNGAIDPSKTPLDKVTPEELDKLSPDAAKNPDKYKPWLGQFIQVKVKGLVYNMQLVGLAHDDLADGSGKAGFSFLSKELLHDPLRMNDEPNNKGGWDESELRKTLNTEIYENQFEINDRNGVNIKHIVKEVKKDYALTGSKYDVYDVKLKRSNDRLWVPSALELFGISNMSNSGKRHYLDYEGDQYEYFINEKYNYSYHPLLAKTPKDAANISGQYYYWLRSVIATTDDGCYLLDSTGSVKNNLSGTYVMGNNYIMLGFCI